MSFMHFFFRHSETPVDPARIQGADTKRPFVVVSEPCCRCGGDGVWKGSFKGTCFRCGGNGKAPSDTRAVRVYTAEQNAKLDVAQAKRDAIAQAKFEVAHAAQQARTAAVAAAFDAAYPLLARYASSENPLLADLVAKGRSYGSLTPAQLALFERVVARQEAEAKRRSTSLHIATVGERVTLDVTCVNVASYERTAFGGRHPQTVWVCSFETPCGVVVVTKTPTLHVERGTVGTLVGTVKAHTSYRDTLQTQLQRAKFTAR